MIDEDIVAVSPSTVYRVLKANGLLYRWNTKTSSGKGKGFKQPKGPNKHWHVDIAYINVKRALEKYPGVHPRLITDNGKQFIAKEFSQRDSHGKRVFTFLWFETCTDIRILSAE